MDKSEILVHISAPSGVVDDARYRAQVEAILNFQSHSRELITLRADETPSHLASSLLHSSASPHLDTNNGSISSPPCVPVQAAKRPASQKDSLGSPVSVIPDSQPQQPEFIAESLHLTPFLLSKRPRLGSPPRSLRGEIQRPETAATASIATASHNTTTQDEQEGDESKQSTLPPEKLEQKQWLDLSCLPLEIKPPPPPIASSPFITHITPTLEMLTKRLKSPRSYNPTNQTRDLDNLERGYWCLRINIASNGPEKPTAPNPVSWDTTFFHNFWTFLSDFIAKEGRAGWGVWCIAEDETPSSRTPVPQETPEGETSQLMTNNITQQLAVKVYAWGEIACHIYLLLFLASERRIRKMGAQWRDARDIVVIQMP
ncbi:hypothetical protein ASPCAL05628 [Aspergillus calidoustus]|uniref:Acetamidase n=1 Tax=Aspergillus calidoustus TaxID=454130 RepID=A0A0U5FXW8_ASPCI|nr:hypothetical protein ASPCAL05628 [Aspergillus calidoustus]